MTNKYLRVIVIVEIQIVLILLVFLVVKTFNVEEKVKRTNQFVFEVLKDKKLEEVSTIDSSDIVIGSKNAPVTMIMYSRLSCQYCKEFLSTTYPELKHKYIDGGYVKFIIRFLIPNSNELGMYYAKCSYFAYKKGAFDQFTSQVVSFDEKNYLMENFRKAIIDLKIDPLGLDSYLNGSNIGNSINSKILSAYQAGISSTPCFLINGNLILGNRKFSKFEELINDALNIINCE